MMDELEALRRFYETEADESIRLAPDGCQYLEYLTVIRYLERYLQAGGGLRILDCCAGSGVYCDYLHGRRHEVTAGDVVEHNVELMRRKGSYSAREMDARDLSRFGDGVFDCVLCMGALYHLKREQDRRRAIRECLRVLKKGGWLFTSYMNPYAVAMNNMCGDLENIEEILAFIKHGKEGVFYAASPEKAVEELAACGATPSQKIALDGIAAFLHSTTGQINEQGLTRYRRFHEEVCEVPSLLGYSYHYLLISQKPFAE